MAQSGSPTSHPHRPIAGGNPGYLVAGVLFYGFVGWLLDRWLETRYLVVVGILLGAGLGIYMTIKRYGPLRHEPHDPSSRNEERA